MKKFQREAVAEIEAVLSPLGVTVQPLRHTKHLILDVRGPSGQRTSRPISCSPRSADQMMDQVRQWARRQARAWGLTA